MLNVPQLLLMLQGLELQNGLQLLLQLIVQSA
jgi:hypothetical protein